MSEPEIIVGIDLGTTNSEVAAVVGDRPRVLGPTPDKMLPSCVGLSPESVEQAAKLGATLMTFKQYSISYLEFLKRLPPNWRKWHCWSPRSSKTDHLTCYLFALE